MSFPFLQPYAGLGNSLQTAQGGAGGVGGWVELGRTTLGSPNSNIDISSIPDKRYYMILTDIHGSSGTDNIHYRVGNGSYDSGTNYAYRYNTNGASESTSTSVNHIIGGAVPSIPAFTIYNVANLSAKEKLWVGSTTNTGTAGAANAPNRREFVSKWANTSNVIDQIRATTTVSSTWDSGSEVVVLGWDPADEHTSNFWEELADASWSSGSSFNTGTFTAKKYLYIQYYTKCASSHFNKFQFNSDTAGNYASRSSYNGGAESIQTNDIYGWSTTTTDRGGSTYALAVANIFMINNASNEKLGISHGAYVRNTETGAGNAPKRTESVGKWANTSNQITRIDITNAVGNDYTGGQIKVWGAD